MLIGSRIKELREINNLSLKELGKLVGVSNVSIHGYENETKMPRMDILKKLAIALNTDVKYLLGLSVVVFEESYTELDYKIIDAIKKETELYNKLKNNFENTIKKITNI